MSLGREVGDLLDGGPAARARNYAEADLLFHLLRPADDPERTDDGDDEQWEKNFAKAVKHVSKLPTERCPGAAAALSFLSDAGDACITRAEASLAAQRIFSLVNRAEPSPAGDGRVERDAR